MQNARAQSKSPAAAGLLRPVGWLLLFAEVVVATPAGLADVAGKALDRLLDLARLLPHGGKRGALDAFGAFVEAIPRRVLENVEDRGVALDHLLVVGHATLGHAAERAEILRDQRHRGLTLLDQRLGLGLGGSIQGEAEGNSKGYDQQPALHVLSSRESPAQTPARSDYSASAGRPRTGRRH